MKKRLIFVGATLILLAAFALRIFFLQPAEQHVQIPEPDLQNVSVTLRESLEDHQQRIRKRPKSSVAWGAYGMCLHQHERFPEALECYTEAARLSPQSAKWPYLKAMIVEQKDLSAAEELLQSAVTLDPSYEPAKLRLAEVFVRSGRFEQADRLIAELPNGPEHSAWAAFLYLQIVVQTDQVKPCSEFVRKLPDQPRLHSREILMTAGQQATRLNLQTVRPDVFFEAAQQVPSVEALKVDPWLNRLREYDQTGARESMQADQLTAVGRWSDAALLLEQLAKEHPDRSRPVLNRALLVARSGDLSGALAELTKLQEQFPEDPLVWFHSGAGQYQLNDQQAAIRSLQRATELKQDYAVAWDLLSDLHAEANRAEQSLAALTQAHQSAPEDVRIAFRLADRLISAEQFLKARTVLSQQKKQLPPDQDLEELWESLWLKAAEQ